MSMVLYGGERVSLSEGVPSLHTIGVALGRIPRFCGHTKEFYPVLGHVLTVASIMPGEFAIYGLMHDAQEALFADVPTPMKTKVARSREHRILDRIYAAYDIPLPSEEAEEAVEEADSKALIAEAHMLGHPGAEQQWGAEYDKEAANATLRHMSTAVRMLQADYAATKFQRAFKLFKNTAHFS